MKCEYDLCIYNRGGLICMREEIRMNCIGMCGNFIPVAIQEEKLEELKQRQFQEITSKHK